MLYYPQLAGYAVILPSFWITIACATFVAALYFVISLTVGDGIDTAAAEEKTLFARTCVMYAVAVIVNIIAKYERARWRQAVERERELKRDRVEFSQFIHDTTAQSAYMIGLGIDTARAQAWDTNPELAATLEAISRLSRSAIWELRHPINMGGIYEGRALSSALKSLAASFTNVTSVPCELTQTGVEPSLSTESRATFALKTALCFLLPFLISHSFSTASTSSNPGAGLSLRYLSDFPGSPQPKPAVQAGGLG